jgi:hypothetical protein
MTPLLIVLVILAVFGFLAWLVFRQLQIDEKTRLIVLLGVILIVALIFLTMCYSGCVPPVLQHAGGA